MHTLLTVIAALIVGTPLSLMVRAQEPAPPKADGPMALQHVAAATKAAGSVWTNAEAFFCSSTPNRANRPDDPELEPTKLFDNLYVIGRVGTAVYAITTSDGIVLIDSGYADQTESVLLPGLKKLGLDPQQIKIVIVAHGHADHFGGAKYLQEHYGARIFVSEKDWDLMERPPARGRGPAAPIPTRDRIAAEGTPITLGNETITVVFIPGHTAGSIGLIFPVKDGRATHIAALYGGTILIPGGISDEGLQQYVQSVRHFAEATKRMKADVELQNHPLYDGIVDKLTRLKERRARQPHAFVVGETGYQNFLTVMSECIQAQIARRSGA